MLKITIEDNYTEIYKQEIKEAVPISDIVEAINYEINKHLRELKDNDND